MIVGFSGKKVMDKERVFGFSGKDEGFKVAEVLVRMRYP